MEDALRYRLWTEEERKATVDVLARAQSGYLLKILAERANQGKAQVSDTEVHIEVQRGWSVPPMSLWSPKPGGPVGAVVPPQPKKVARFQLEITVEAEDLLRCVEEAQTAYLQNSLSGASTEKGGRKEVVVEAHPEARMRLIILEDS